MIGFARMLKNGFEQTGHQVTECHPRPFFARFAKKQSFMGKWCAYADKYLRFPRQLRHQVRKWKTDLVHVCDHSNALYLPAIQELPHTITCHDVIAIRSGLGHFQQAQVGKLGKKLQSRILANLRTAEYVNCDSENSRGDLTELAPELANKSNVIHLGFNQPMMPIEEPVARKLLREKLPAATKPFILHVGNDAWYKNRMAVLGVFSLFRKSFGQPVQLALVGPPLNKEHSSYAIREGFIDEVIVVESSSTEVLRALYSKAIALVFPSLYEGFGWPPLEAQACGCPVIASPLGSLSEILANGGIIEHPDNLEAYASTLSRLENDDVFRNQEITKGHKNAKRFDAQNTITAYLKTYEDILARRKATL